MIAALRSKGDTIVLVGQNFRLAAPLADRFHVMHNGRIVERFDAAELKPKTPMLSELIGVCSAMRTLVRFLRPALS